MLRQRSGKQDTRWLHSSYQGRRWDFVAGVQIIEAPQAPRIREPKVPLGTNFLIEFLQISGVHLIVPGGPDPRTPCQLSPCYLRPTLETDLLRWRVLKNPAAAAERFTTSYTR
jgi:hypothetical protein